MKARGFERGSEFGILGCSQAIAESGYDVAAAPESIGSAMGTGSAGAGALTEFLRVLFVESPEAAPPFHFPNPVANAPASQASIELKIYGPNVTITQKDPSGLNALLFAALAIGSGRAQGLRHGAADRRDRGFAIELGRGAAGKRANGVHGVRHVRGA